MFVLETQHRGVPWRWVVLLSLFSLTAAVGSFAANNFVFTLRKYVSSPALISSISSLDVLFNILVAATCLYLSDRVWTRFGRRKIFIVPGWLGMALCLVFVPQAEGLVGLMVPMVLFMVCIDVAATFGILQMEIVPPHQRGRLSALNAFFFQILILVWFVGVGGRFDDATIRPEGMLRGEQGLYWFAATVIAGSALFVAFFVRERPPAGPPPPASTDGALVGVFKNLFLNRALWPVYLLAFTQTLLATGLGAIDPLLMTEQWGYSKQELGTNIFVGGMISLATIPIIGWLVDRVDRVKLYMFAEIAGVALIGLYYVFVQFILADRRPEIWQIILFGQLMSMAGQVVSITFNPMIFDYVPRSQMGTTQAGLNFVRSATRFAALNGVGLWVTGYSMIFMPEGVYDYFSGYLFVFLLQGAGLCFLVMFVRRVRDGRIQPLGRTEFKPVDAPPADNKEASA
jgi:Na+/melibiose symporter-like transporter